MHIGMQSLLRLFLSTHVGDLERSEPIIKPVEFQEGDRHSRANDHRTKLELSSLRVKPELVFADRIIVDTATLLSSARLSLTSGLPSSLHVVTRRGRL